MGPESVAIDDLRRCPAGKEPYPHIDSRVPRRVLIYAESKYLAFEVNSSSGHTKLRAAVITGSTSCSARGPESSIIAIERRISSLCGPSASLVPTLGGVRRLQIDPFEIHNLLRLPVLRHLDIVRPEVGNASPYGVGTDDVDLDQVNGNAERRAGWCGRLLRRLKHTTAWDQAE